MKNVFISFSSVQESEANRICRLLEKNGIECFISTRDLMAGEEYASQLLENIDDADAVVLLLSKESNTSPHVLREVEYAVSHSTPILVYALEEVELSKSLEYFLMTHQWITGSDSKDRRLVDSVHHIMSTKGKTAKADELKEFKAVLENDSDTKNDGVLENESVIKNKQDELKTNNSKSIVLLGIIAVLVLVIIILLVLVLNLSKRPEKTLSEDAVTADDIQTNSSKEDAVNKQKEAAGVKETEENTEKEEIIIPPYEVGQYVTFGTYYEDPIEWRIIKINEDGTMIILSKDILCMKIFDSAEGGEYNDYQGVDYGLYENHIIEDEDLQVMVRGSNDWSKSNLRTWLNSDKEVVDYKDQAPTKKAAGVNFYSTEPGFLYNFSKEERDAIVSVEHQTSTDKVFLLSSAELKWLKDEGLPIYAKPTKKCMEHDNESFYYDSFVEYAHVESYYWWLRDSSGEKANEANAVVTEYEDGQTYTTLSVGASAWGVRPAVCVDMTSEAIVLIEN